MMFFTQNDSAGSSRRSRSHDRAGTHSSSLGRRILRADEYAMSDLVSSGSREALPPASQAPPPKPMSLASKLSRSFYDLASNDRLSKWKTKLSGGGSGKSKSDAKRQQQQQQQQEAHIVDSAAIIADENIVWHAPGDYTTTSNTTPSSLSSNQQQARPSSLSQPKFDHNGNQTKTTTWPNAAMFDADEDGYVYNRQTQRTHKQKPKSPVFVGDSYYYDSSDPNRRASASSARLRHHEGNSPLSTGGRRSEGSHLTFGGMRPYEEIDSLWPVPAADEREHTDSRTLPPPARITPFSGVIQQNRASDIIRPVAYRPGSSSQHNSTNALNNMIMQRSSDSDKFYQSDGYNTNGVVPRHSQNRSADHQSRSINRLSENDIGKTPSTNYYRNLPLQPVNSNGLGSFPAYDGMATSRHSTSEINYIANHPHGSNTNPYQASKNVFDQVSMNVRSRRKPMYHKADEDDYDSVPEFVELLKEHLTDSESQAQKGGGYINKQHSHLTDQHNPPDVSKRQTKSQTSLHQIGSAADSAAQMITAGFNPIPPQKPQPAPRQSLMQQQQQQNNTKSTNANNQQQQQQSASKSIDQTSSSGHGTSSFASSRQSSGPLHVTPSPSDSGVAELEAVLRDKDSELNSLRNHMEHNEEVIIRVYQEKEQRWQTELRDAQHKLRTATHNERKLLHEIQRLRDEVTLLQQQVQPLQQEKDALKRTCKSLESQMFEAKDQLRALQSASAGRPSQSTTTTQQQPQQQQQQFHLCRNCGGDVQQHDATHSTSGGSQTGSDRPKYPLAFSNGHDKSPTPKAIALSSSAQGSELRTDMDALSLEVAGLKQTLRDQMKTFATERNRWDEEKQQILQYQKTLQYNFLQMSQRNQDLENQLVNYENRR